MSDERKNPVGLWIVALLIGLPVLYVASFGPACWLTSRTGFGASAVPAVYRPMTWTWRHGGRNRPVGLALDRYCCLGAADHWVWTIDPYLDEAGNLVGEPRWRRFDEN